MAQYILSDKEVSTIHNGVLYLTNALDYAKDTLNANSAIVRHLEQSIKYLEPIRDDLLGKQDMLWNKQHNYFTDVQQNNGFTSIWSIYTYDDFSFDDKHDLPEGLEFTCWDVPQPDGRFKLEGSTWKDVWKCVDEYMQHYSDDVGNHVFIESFEVVEKNGKSYIQIGLGS